jgi:hypothetical protein
VNRKVKLLMKCDGIVKEERQRKPCSLPARVLLGQGSHRSLNNAFRRDLV